uniref:Uncharacterized protein n=1 Tax=Rhizophora mucronata TaxID=61149 RepID=A0A2P2N7Z6_RHIMU
MSKCTFLTYLISHGTVNGFTCASVDVFICSEMLEVIESFRFFFLVKFFYLMPHFSYTYVLCDKTCHIGACIIVFAL